MTATDASLWVSRFLSDDVFHEASRSWLARVVAEGAPLLAPTTLLAEVFGAIARRTGNSALAAECVDQIRRVPTLQVVAIDAQLGDVAAEVAATYRLRGGDAIYVAVAQHLRLPLVSWDDEQVTRAEGAVAAFRPDEWPGEAPADS